jgi:phage shock protein C
MERKLHRIEGGNSVVGGVAAGLADYFAIDVAIIRVLFVLGFFTPIPSVIAYFILWMVLPRQFGNSPVTANDYSTVKNSSNNPNPFSNMTTGKQSGSQIGGIILVILGGIFLADEFLPWFDFGKLWPLILIAVGLWILVKDKKEPESTFNATNSNTNTTTATPVAPTEPQDTHDTKASDLADKILKDSKLTDETESNL